MKFYNTKSGIEVKLRLPEEVDAKEIIEFYRRVGKETTYLGLVRENIKYQKKYNQQQSKK